MSEPLKSQLIDLTRKLLDAISDGDLKTYRELCDESLTAFEPEGRGQLIVGMAFHEYYFKLPGHSGPRQTTMAAPQVRLLGDDVGIVTYVRLMQRISESGQPATATFEETRVWHRKGKVWKHVHFHRSQPA